MSTKAEQVLEPTEAGNVSVARFSMLAAKFQKLVEHVRQLTVEHNAASKEVSA